LYQKGLLPLNVCPYIAIYTTDTFFFIVSGGCNACGADGELRELVRDSLEANTESPESWIAAAVYWSARGHVTKALGYAEKALR
jgi:hypothetical protein